jgi:hypothetical protein
MNMGSDCYGSFAHGIGAELLTESVQVEGLGERRGSHEDVQSGFAPFKAT